MALPKLGIQNYKTKFPHNGVTVTYRPMLLSEEKIIITQQDIGSESDKISAVKSVVGACIIEGPDVNSLSTFEIEYLFILIFKRSKDEDIVMNFKCPKCKDDNDKPTRTQFMISLDEVEFKYHEDHSNVVMLNETVGVELKYPTFDFMEDLKNSGADTVETSIEALIDLVDCVFDGDDVHDFKIVVQKEKIEFFDQLTRKQFGDIVNFVKTMPYVGADKEVVCHKCNHQEKLKIEGLLSFLA